MTDDQALTRLETLAKTQARPDRPWSPVLPYDIDSRRAAEGEHPALIKSVLTPEHVLDYGCGAGFLVAFLAEKGLRVTGYDPSDANDDKIPPYVSHLITHGEPNPSQGRYDVVICREVLEHLPFMDVRPTVARLCALSSRYVYVTTRFAASPDHFLAVDTADPLDPTHITMLTPGFLRLLFVLEGFTRRADLEQRLDWRNLGRVLVYERVP